MADDEVQYEFKSVKAVRGLEARTIAKWEKLGWELDTQTPGTLRTELTFRRIKVRMPKALLVGIGGLVALVVIGGVVAAIVGGNDAESEPTSSPISSSSPPVPSETPSESSPTPEETVEEPEESEPTAATYTYEGPKYEVVTVDQNQGPAKLTQYWVYTSKFDYSTDDYMEPVKLIIADVARAEGAPELIVQVVTDAEIALAESPSTQARFIKEYGDDYFVHVIPEKEKQGWVASYTGGFDYNTGKPSDSADAFEILWRPYATSEFETWKPEIAG